MELSPHPHGYIHCAIDFIDLYLIGIFHVYTYINIQGGQVKVVNLLRGDSSVLINHCNAMEF